MFCNLIDTVRKSHLDHVQIEGIFFKAILNRHKPTLSLNLLVDSAPILMMARENDAFLSFVKDEVIRAGLYSDGAGIMEYLHDRLVPEDAENSVPYEFSSLPFLKTNFSHKEIRRIYSKMWDSLVTGCNCISSDLVPDENHRELIDRSLRTIRKLSANLEGHYIPPKKNETGPLLSRRIDLFVARLLQQDPDASIPYGIETLQKEFRKLRIKLGINPNGTEDVKKEPLFYKRSAIYHFLENNTAGDPSSLEEAKAIVDLCYNETIAASLQDNERDLIVNITPYSSLNSYVQTDTSKLHQQTVTCVDALNAYPEELFTWEITKEIYDRATQICKAPEAWNEVVARCCEEYGLPKFEPGIDCGCQPISFYSTVLRSASETDFSIYEEDKAREFLKKSCDRPWIMHTDDPTVCDPDTSEPNDHRKTSICLKDDYAGGNN